MANAFCGHQGHALIDRLVEANIDDGARHDFFDERGGRCAAVKNNLARVVALRDQTDDFIGFRDHEGTDLLFSHALERVEYRRVGRDAPDVASFNLEDVSNYLHRDLLLKAKAAEAIYTTK